MSRAVVDLSVISGLLEIVESRGDICYPVTTDAQGEELSYRIEGCTCLGIDILAEKVTLPRLVADHRRPDGSSRIYFTGTGAYTLDYIGIGKGPGFNGSPFPQIYCLDGERLYELNIKAETAVKEYGARIS